MTETMTLQRTPLYDVQKKLGAKFVDFHGWELPVQFSSVIQEHAAVRQACGLFDVSHMGEFWVTGPQAYAFLQEVCSNDMRRASPGKAIYTHLLNEKGGVVDDVIVYCIDRDRYLLVVNAATQDKDYSWLGARKGKKQVDMSNVSAQYSLLAIQGPGSVPLMEKLVPKAVSLPRFGVLERSWSGAKEWIGRTGYTGEDGFEMVTPSGGAARLYEKILDLGRSHGIVPCGLGARDTLRLEAGYLLYGQDVDDHHSPLEAGYAWVVRWDKGHFIGREALERQKKEGLPNRLLGFRVQGMGGVPRTGMQIFKEDEPVGQVTSGTFSPTLKEGIAMGYVTNQGLTWKAGDSVSILIHSRMAPAQVVDLPFYKRGV